jgi:hypothetical protein
MTDTVVLIKIVDGKWVVTDNPDEAQLIEKINDDGSTDFLLRADPVVEKGGPGSGNRGHAGRPGQVGGSAKGQGGASTSKVAGGSTYEDEKSAILPSSNFAGDNEIYPKAKDIPGLNPNADPREEFIRLFGSDSIEHYFALDEKGKIICFGNGDKESIWMPHAIDDYLKHTAYIHNHPGAGEYALGLGSPSLDDVLVAIDTDMDSMTAVGKKYIGILRPKLVWPDKEKVRMAMGKDGVLHLAYLNAKRGAAHLNDDYEIERVAWKAYWHAFARIFNCEYEEYDR